VAAAAVFAMTFSAAFSGIVEFREDFEGPSRWFAGPGAGFDHNKGYAHRGTGNGWVRNGSGWSAVNAWFTLPGIQRGQNCTAEAWIRVSPTATRAYFSIREGNGTIPGAVIRELRVLGTSPPTYRRYSFDFPASGGPMLIYAGNWGNPNDPWLQIDDVAVSCGRFSY
jgi:hypothetical protein